ncbi:MAG: hypothetical protein IT315_10905 [Anaerolineales bacterium]|nr:hypothetical protein [Anaerolineales bacterium]
MSGHDNIFLNWVLGIYALASIIGLWVAMAILIRLLRKTTHLWTRTGDTFGMDSRSKLISLGITALFFSRLIYSLFNAVIYFISNFFIEAPQELLTNWINSQSACTVASDVGTPYCISQLSFGFIQAWTSALSGALNRFSPSYISYSQLLFMLAFWAIIGLMFSQNTTESRNTITNRKMWLQTALEQLSSTSKQNIIFFIVLAFAVYLSIAAITAIPGLQESAIPSESISIEKLDEQLSETLSQFQIRIPQQLELADPFIDLEAQLQEKGENESTNQLYLDLVSVRKVGRQQVLSAYQKMQSNLRTDAENSKSEAINAYRASTIDRVGSQETVQHFLLINAWFRRMLNAFESQTKVCVSRIENLDILLSFWSTDLSNQIKNGNQDSYQLNTDFPISSASTDALHDCRSQSYPESVPSRPSLGSTLGIFGYVASWLLRTESLPLAQIVGMLGFGLLGSAVSSLIRRGNKRNFNEPLVNDLAAVIIRGATAAVVVFLAVKGGLAIFTTGANDPNSYVLLLTCLVAAVFSEDVWREAHKRLLKTLDDSEEAKPPSKKKK